MLAPRLSSAPKDFRFRKKRDIFFVREEAFGKFAPQDSRKRSAIEQMNQPFRAPLGMRDQIDLSALRVKRFDLLDQSVRSESPPRLQAHRNGNPVGRI